jgi:chaperonin cofactor prefoldin
VVRQADVDVRAHDAEASTADNLEPDRPATRDELEYLDQRVEETSAAVKKIKGQIKGLERALAEAEKLHEDAKAAKRAGRDLPAVQKRRAS